MPFALDYFNVKKNTKGCVKARQRMCLLMSLTGMFVH